MSLLALINNAGRHPPRALRRMLVAGLAGVLALAGAAHAQSVTKTGRDLTTQSTTDTQAGRTVRYAISLGLPAGQTAAQVNVQDAIPPGLQYVAGSLQLPGNATGAWSTNGGTSYVGVEPASGVTNVQITGSAYMAATSALGTVPTPPSASASGGTGGDGYRAIPYNGKVYSIYHHNGGDSLYCGNQATAVACPGFPTSVPAAAGAAFSSGSWYETSLEIAEYLDRNTGRMYFWVKDQATQKPAVVCANLQDNTSCGSYVFSNAPVIPNPTASGWWYFTLTGGHAGSRFYANGANGRMLCFDTATFTPCAGTDSAGTFAVAGAPATTGYDANDGVGQIGSKLYWQAVSASPVQTTLVCFDMATNAACAGFTPSTFSKSGMFMPTASTSGVTNGFCLGRVSPGTRCYDLNGSDVTTTQAAFASYADSNPLAFSGTNLDSLGAAVLADGPAVPNSRTFWQTSSAKMCWDWTTNAPCASYDPSLGFGYYFYEATIDPASPTCVWSLGDSGTLGATSSIDGGACKVQTKVAIQANPSGSYCDGKAHRLTWARVTLTGLQASDYGSAKVTIRGVDGNPLPAWNGVTATFPIDLSAYPITGNTASLTVEVELVNITNVAPFNTDPKPYVSVVWDGEPQQACFDAKLACDDGNLASPLTNTVSGTIAGQAVSNSHSFTNVAKACWVPPPATPPAPVPTMAEWVLAALGGLMLLLGWGALRRRAH